MAHGSLPGYLYRNVEVEVRGGDSLCGDNLVIGGQGWSAAAAQGARRDYRRSNE